MFEKGETVEPAMCPEEVEEFGKEGSKRSLVEYFRNKTLSKVTIEYDLKDKVLLRELNKLPGISGKIIADLEGKSRDSSDSEIHS